MYKGTPRGVRGIVNALQGIASSLVVIERGRVKDGTEVDAKGVTLDGGTTSSSFDGLVLFFLVLLSVPPASSTDPHDMARRRYLRFSSFVLFVVSRSMLLFVISLLTQLLEVVDDGTLSGSFSPVTTAFELPVFSGGFRISCASIAFLSVSSGISKLVHSNCALFSSFSI